MDLELLQMNLDFDTELSEMVSKDNYVDMRARALARITAHLEESISYQLHEEDL